MNPHFGDRLVHAIREKGTPACVGLDPLIERLPADVLSEAGIPPAPEGQPCPHTDLGAVADALLTFGREIIRTVAPIVGVIKINIAFFERYYTEGMRAYYELVRRAQLEQLLRQDCEHGVKDRVDRFLQAQHHGIVANTGFAAASSECVDLFRDGHFYGCVSLSQAVGEALIRHVNVCNRCRPSGEFETNVRTLERRRFITAGVARSCRTLWKNRDDYHHLNPNVERDRSKLERLALSKIRCLAAIEAWVFSHSFRDGTLVIKRPQYWPNRGSGTVDVFLRFPTV